MKNEWCLGLLFLQSSHSPSGNSIFPNSLLGGQRKLLEGLQLGSVGFANTEHALAN